MEIYIQGIQIPYIKIQICGNADIWIYTVYIFRYKDIYKYKYIEIRIFRYTHIQTCGYLEILIQRDTAIQKYRYIDIQIYLLEIPIG